MNHSPDEPFSEGFPNYGADPIDTVVSMFSAINDRTPYDNAVFADDSLLKAIGYEGGACLNGAAQILHRAAVTAYLNPADDEVDYPLTTAQVVASFTITALVIRTQG